MDFMSKTVSPTELRKNLYNLIDQVIESGEPLTIVRGEHRLTLHSASSPRKSRCWDKPAGFTSALPTGTSAEDLYKEDAWEWNPEKKVAAPLAAEPTVPKLTR